MKISILLATYNGEKYLSEQIDSILKQTYQNFMLYISDDKSCDNTMNILNEYKNKYPDKIVILKNDKASGSSKGNFLHLLEEVTSDLYFFCDQDDVWTDNHLEIFIKKYNNLSENERDKPLLFHSDLKVVDASLNIVANSFLSYAKLPHNPRKRFYYLGNNVTGCVCMINNALKNLVLKDKSLLMNNIQKIPMHDHFFSFISVIFGKKYFLKQKTNLYRQHEKNVLGADAYSLKNNVKKIVSKEKHMQFIAQNNRILNESKNFVEFFLLYFNENLGKKEKQIMTDYINIHKKNKVSRIIFLIKYGILRKGFFKNLVLFSFI